MFWKKTIPNKSALAEQYKADKENLENQKTNDISEIARTQLNLSRMSKTLYGTEHFSEKRNHASTIIWIIGLILVAIVEIPVNAASFSIFFRPNLETIAMACGFGLLMAFLAHYTGFGLRRLIAGDGARGFLGILSLAIAIVVLYRTANFRVNFGKYMETGNLLDLEEQFTFALGIFMIGAAGAYNHTSGTKNYKLEKDFKSDLNKLRKLKSDVASFKKRESALLKQYNKNFNNLSDAEAKEAKQKELDQQQAKKDEDMEAAGKRKEFESLESQFNSSLKDAESIRQSYSSGGEVNRAGLDSSDNFKMIVAKLKILLDEIGVIVNSVTDGKDRLDIMTNKYNLVIA